MRAVRDKEPRKDLFEVAPNRVTDSAFVAQTGEPAARRITQIAIPKNSLRTMDFRCLLSEAREL